QPFAPSAPVSLAGCFLSRHRSQRQGAGPNRSFRSMDHCSTASRRSGADVSIIRGSAHGTEWADECGAQDRRCRRRAGWRRGGAALAAKQQDAAAEVILLSDERQEPYEKPPLSKAVLTGKAMPHDAPIAGPKGVSGSGVRLTLGTPVKAIDRSAHAVITDTGE